MTDGEAKSNCEGPSLGSAGAADLLPNICGIQVVGATATAQDTDLARKEALRLELEARANRLIQAVDEAIVLANDGLIRWLGDPVARIAPGQDILAPKAVILADAELPSAAQEAVATRIELWLQATTRRLLGPLFGLRELQEEPAPIRGLAQKVAAALGVLDRARVRSEVRELDQSSRAPLRRHGVRFGAYYIYVPTVLKPAARALALQLWSLHSAAVSHAESPAEKLTLLTASGRTSVPFDSLIPAECYRVSGFRPCGERAVRVDIVERLADLVRAASTPSSLVEAEERKGAKSGFVISNQMTSLVGCSGKNFESVLRSMGYESFEAKRSDLDALASASPGEGDGASGEDPIAPEAAPAEAAGGFQPFEADHVEPEPEPTSSFSSDEAVGAVIDSPTAEEAPPPDPQLNPENQQAESETVLLWRAAAKPPRQFDLRRRRREKHADHDKGTGRKSPIGGQIAELAATETEPLEKQGGLGVGESANLERRKPRAKWSRGAQRSPEKPAKDRASRRLLPEPPARFDPASPFAKLLELRSVLEREQKKQK